MGAERLLYARRCARHLGYHQEQDRNSPAHPPTRALQSSGASVGELYLRVLEVPGPAGTRGGDPNLQGVREGFSELH